MLEIFYLCNNKYQQNNNCDYSGDASAYFKVCPMVYVRILWLPPFPGADQCHIRKYGLHATEDFRMYTEIKKEVWSNNIFKYNGGFRLLSNTWKKLLRRLDLRLATSAHNFSWIFYQIDALQSWVLIFTCAIFAMWVKKTLFAYKPLIIMKKYYGFFSAYFQLERYKKRAFSNATFRFIS